MVVYISGKYSGNTKKNIAIARKIAIELWEKGYTVICPHLNTQNFEKDSKLSYGDFISGDIEILLRCDCIIMLPNWKESKGAQYEYGMAKKSNIPIYEYPNLPKFRGKRKRWKK